MLGRCAIYTRKSSEEGLEQNFNSLHAQREACEAFIKSQTNEGWRLVRTDYDDGGLSGASMERPALQRLLGDIRQGLIEVVVIYKVDRLTRPHQRLLFPQDGLGADQAFGGKSRPFLEVGEIGYSANNRLTVRAQVHSPRTGKALAYRFCRIATLVCRIWAAKDP
jgi:serine/threonine protein kinase HipA of HipAB toxin-antitoxin module